MTVVVETDTPLTYVGRYDRRDESGVHLLNVGIHDSQSSDDRRQYISRSLKFGVRAEQRSITIPADRVARVTRLTSWE